MRPIDHFAALTGCLLGAALAIVLVLFVLPMDSFSYETGFLIGGFLGLVLCPTGMAIGLEITYRQRMRGKDSRG